MKIAVVTATRAEYGILKPLIAKLDQDEEFELQIVVTGAHLSKNLGDTQNEIVQDGFEIFCRIPIQIEGDSAIDISGMMANAINGFARYFDVEKPDCVVILGDRTEMLGVAMAAMNAGVPIAHLHGGEITEGAVDDCVRHALTKMSYVHFAATETYRKRIIQMGEEPERVFNVGSLGVENVLRTELMTEEELRMEVGIPPEMKFIVVTYHPVTMELSDEKDQILNLLAVMEASPQYFWLITKANADAGGIMINQALERFVQGKENAKLVASLGMRRYLSAVKYAAMVLGNSSSGIIEAPAFGTPTVNIGNRQKGRLAPQSVIMCKSEKADILRAMDEAERYSNGPDYMYGNGLTSERIIAVLKETFTNNSQRQPKHFFDIAF